MKCFEAEFNGILYPLPNKNIPFITGLKALIICFI